MLAWVLPKAKVFHRFDSEIIAHIDRIGVHPFIVVRLRERNGMKSHLIVCQTENDVSEFIERVGAFPDFAQTKLLRAIVLALQQDAYDAAELLLSWVMEPEAAPYEGALIGLPAHRRRGWFYGYPAFDIVRNTSRPETPEQRVDTLIAILNAYDATNGNNRLRFAIIEAFAFGLCRALGSMGRFAEARHFVERAQTHAKHSMHLKAAAYALQLRLAGDEVPGRLSKFIGRDDGYLKQFICPHPFENFEINHTGEVLTCAGPWISVGIGDLLTDNAESIVNSATARGIRKSIISGTYKYCNHLECTRMIQGSLPRREEVEKTHIGSLMTRKDHPVDAVKGLVFAFDKTCNLSCPSCRTALITEKSAVTNAKVRVVEEKLPELLPSLRSIEINASGELFASKSSRKFLELLEIGHYPNLRLDIISNGTLFNEGEWNKFPGIHDKIRSVRISTDAASKATFEKLRRGGRYESFLENVRFLSRLRAKGTIPVLKFSFTYQAANFREMHEFIDFCTEMRADFVLFERLLNMVFSDQEYREKAVHLKGHPHHKEFLSIISDPVFRSWRVWHDFEYPGVEKLAASEAKRRFEWLYERAGPSSR